MTTKMDGSILRILSRNLYVTFCYNISRLFKFVSPRNGTYFIISDEFWCGAMSAEQIIVLGRGELVLILVLRRI